MSLEGILKYTLRAGIFALGVGAVCLLLSVLICRARGRRVVWRKLGPALLLAVYLAALVQITVLRDYTHLWTWWTLPHGWGTVQLIPLADTLAQWGNGAWAVLYPVLGNILWFLPLGALLPAVRTGTSRRQTVLAALLLSCGIEWLQWVLQSGISDVDDVIFNVLGGMLGFELWKFWDRLRKDGKPDRGA